MSFEVLISLISLILGVLSFAPLWKFLHWNFKGYLEETNNFLDKFQIKFYLQKNDKLPFISTSLGSIIMNVDRKIYGSSFLNGKLNSELSTNLTYLGNDEFIFSYNWMYFYLEDNTFFSSLELIESGENYIFFDNKLFIPIPFYKFQYKKFVFWLISFFRKLK